MELSNKYRIEYAILEKGKHYFSFEIDNSFFNLFKYSEIKKGQIKADVLLEYTEGLIFTEIKLNGIVKTNCDICLEEFDLKVENEFNLYFKFNEEEFDSEDEDVIIISPEDDFIEFSKHFYDYIILSLPIKKAHPFDENGERTCNAKGIEKLDTFAPSQKLNNSPEWDKLKSLYNK